MGERGHNGKLLGLLWAVLTLVPGSASALSFGPCERPDLEVANHAPQDSGAPTDTLIWVSFRSEDKNLPRTPDAFHAVLRRPGVSEIELLPQEPWHAELGWLVFKPAEELLPETTYGVRVLWEEPEDVGGQIGELAFALEDDPSIVVDWRPQKSWNFTTGPGPAEGALLPPTEQGHSVTSAAYDSSRCSGQEVDFVEVEVEVEVGEDSFWTVAVWHLNSGPEHLSPRRGSLLRIEPATSSPGDSLTYSLMSADLAGRVSETTDEQTVVFPLGGLTCSQSSGGGPSLLIALLPLLLARRRRIAGASILLILSLATSATAAPPEPAGRWDSGFASDPWAAPGIGSALHAGTCAGAALAVGFRARGSGEVATTCWTLGLGWLGSLSAVGLFEAPPQPGDGAMHSRNFYLALTISNAIGSAVAGGLTVLALILEPFLPRMLFLLPAGISSFALGMAVTQGDLLSQGKRTSRLRIVPAGLGIAGVF